MPLLVDEERAELGAPGVVGGPLQRLKHRYDTEGAAGTAMGGGGGGGIKDRLGVPVGASGGGGGGGMYLRGRPQRRLDRRLGPVAKAVGGSYRRLQMPLNPALAVRETGAGHRLGAPEWGGGVPAPLPMHPKGGGRTATQRTSMPGGLPDSGMPNLNGTRTAATVLVPRRPPVPTVCNRNPATHNLRPS